MIGPFLAALLVAVGPAPARLQVGADEFWFALSRSAIKKGPAIVELVNYGEDPHDLRLRRVGGTRTLGIGRVAPGRRGELQATLAPGKWQVWCAIGDHRKRGMRATLVVRR